MYIYVFIGGLFFLKEEKIKHWFMFLNLNVFLLRRKGEGEKNTWLRQMKEKVVANENLMRKQRTELHLALYFCWRVKRSLARRQTWRPLAVNNKADKDSRVPSRRTSAEIPQSFCHYSLCSLLMCSICILSRCGLCTLFRLLAGKIMQNSNAGHTVQMLIFLSIQQPILCINLHYNGRGNKKKGGKLSSYIFW